MAVPHLVRANTGDAGGGDAVGLGKTPATEGTDDYFHRLLSEPMAV